MSRAIYMQLKLDWAACVLYGNANRDNTLQSIHRVCSLLPLKTSCFRAPGWPSLLDVCLQLGS